MYLYRLRIDASTPQGRRDLSSPYEQHATLVRAFVASEEGTPPRILWRQEAASAAEVALLVQSPVPADWQRIEERAPGYVRAVDEKTYDPSRLARASDQFVFRLAANPSAAQERKRYALLGEEQQQAWLARQGERHGFKVLGAERNGEWRIEARKRGRNRIQIHAVRFDGRLQVEDPEAFAYGLEHGIGRGKAFGLGMLTVAPLTRTEGL